MSRRQKADGVQDDVAIDDHGFVFKPAKPKNRSAKPAATKPAPPPSAAPPPPQPPPPLPAAVPATPTPRKQQQTRRATVLPGGPLDLRIQVLRPRYSLCPPRAGRDDYSVDIPLVGDTPIIARNKSLREAQNSGGRRRSSLGLRGKRTSTAHNGLCPPPHETIDPKSYYRHIDADLSDPIRMRQLLVWCAQKSIGPEDSMGSAKPLDPRLAQILIDAQKEVITGLTSKEINTSWYHRPADPSEHVETPQKRLPHPQNIANAKKLAEYNSELDRLSREEDRWMALLQQYTPNETDNLGMEKSSGLKRDDEAVLTPADRDVALMECAGDSARELDAWMKTTFEDLRVELDATLDTLQKVEAFERRTRRFTDGIFNRVLAAYAEKETARDPVDPMDVLRLLSSVAASAAP
ncbi:hypothetical protein HDU87_004524 [Geranomyces variabilis]|uniref:Kinetochore protein mis13 n=1 Tax=Geranomyces variabilis TaxID=109894 RepID=A0AAD5XMD8_9FUNG|nr:hypothetical protein HDU87_004524 [Geranomyces variabilis]